MEQVMIKYDMDGVRQFSNKEVFQIINEVERFHLMVVGGGIGRVCEHFGALQFGHELCGHGLGKEFDSGWGWYDG